MSNVRTHEEEVQLYERHQDYLYMVAKGDNQVYNWLKWQVAGLCDWVAERPDDIREIISHERSAKPDSKEEQL